MDHLLVNRVEVIDETGRAYTKWEETPFTVQMVLQDDERTLKLFLEKEESNE